MSIALLTGVEWRHYICLPFQPIPAGSPPLRRNFAGTRKEPGYHVAKAPTKKPGGKKTVKNAGKPPAKAVSKAGSPPSKAAHKAVSAPSKAVSKAAPTSTKPHSKAASLSAKAAHKAVPSPSKATKTPITAKIEKHAGKPARVETPKNGKPVRLFKSSQPPVIERPSRYRAVVEERHIAPIPEAVPTDGKPRKNQVGYSPRDLEQFRDLLLAKRRELVGDMSAMEREALRSSGETNLSTLPIHMADMGTDNYEQEFTLGLVEKDRNLLREINAALAKIQNGTFGICEGTGKPIGRARLEAQPWSRFSIEWARKLEVRRGF